MTDPACKDPDCSYRAEIEMGYYIEPTELDQLRRDTLTWRRRYEALAEALDEYRLWEPGRKGHAAAHRQLYAVLDGTDPNA